MYCVKVTPGKERASIRSYPSGFLPSYKPAFIVSDSPVDRTSRVNDKGVKRLVVPGYVFMLKSDRRSEAVNDAEWMIIDAISDTHPSVLDPETGKVVDGPLTAVNDFITRVDGDCIQISATLLGIGRKYQIRVKLKSDESQEEADQITGTEVQPVEEKREYTKEEHDKMLARAAEVGVHAAAKEYGIPWQTLASMKRKADKEASEQPSEKKTAEKKKPEKKPETGEKKKPGRKPKTAEPKEAPKEEPADDLLAENTALKEKLAKLEEKHKKLQKAMMELISE